MTKRYKPGRGVISKGVDLLDRFNDMMSGGISLKNGLQGEILELVFAPNETKVVSHGLKAVPRYRLILRQTGNGLITDVNESWTKKSVGFLNNSANTITVTIKIFLE